MGYDSVMKYVSILLLLILPSLTLAQGTPNDIQGFGRAFINFLNGTLVAFFFALALLIFIYNVIRYFIVDKDSYDKKEKARRYMIWSVAGFVLMVSIWGVVNMFVTGLNLGRELPICPDSISPEQCASWGVQ